MRRAPTIRLSPEERAVLEAWSGGRAPGRRLVLRARIVLGASRGLENRGIARELATRPNTVGLWRRRFALFRLGGLREEAPRTGREPRIPPELVQRIVDSPLRTRPRGGARWSTRSLAVAMGVSHMTVQRVWRAHRLQRRSWPLSSRRRPGVEAQYVDVVGMYRNAPGRAVAFAVDDFPRADGSSRSRSSVGKGVGLPRGGTRVRARGSLGDLVAALRPFETREVARGRDSDQHRDFLSFLRRIDVEAPEALQVHLVLDDRRAHTTTEVERWLRHHPRFVLHFVPAGASLSAVASAWLSEREPATPGLDHLESAGALRRAVLALGRRGYGRAEPWVWTRGIRRARPAVSRTRRRLGPAGMLPPDLRLG